MLNPAVPAPLALRADVPGLGPWVSRAVDQRRRVPSPSTGPRHRLSVSQFFALQQAAAALTPDRAQKGELPKRKP